MKLIRGPTRQYTPRGGARLGRCRNPCAPTIGNHLLRCRVIASTPGTGLPDSFQPDGNDNADAAITLSADNRAPFVIAHDGDLIRPTLAVFSGPSSALAMSVVSVPAHRGARAELLVKTTRSS